MYIHRRATILGLRVHLLLLFEQHSSSNVALWWIFKHQLKVIVCLLLQPLALLQLPLSHFFNDRGFWSFVEGYNSTFKHYLEHKKMCYVSLQLTQSLSFANFCTLALLHLARYDLHTTCAFLGLICMLTSMDIQCEANAWKDNVQCASPFVLRVWQSFPSCDWSLPYLWKDTSFFQNGRTALHYGTIGQHLEVVKYLHQSGADRTIPDNVRCAYHFVSVCTSNAMKRKRCVSFVTAICTHLDSEYWCFGLWGNITCYIPTLRTIHIIDCIHDSNFFKFINDHRFQRFSHVLQPSSGCKLNSIQRYMHVLQW